MLIERDIPVRMRDGVRVYVDIFRPGSAKNLPVILTWSPYGKHAFKTFAVFPNSGVPEGAVSRHAVWEGPDPLYWTKQGYAVINGDCRGSWGSEGDLVIHGPEEAEDGYDVIEWAAQLPWCNGRVGMAGVSYLAIVQWRIAALHPPHLACINPWEGLSDEYREYGFHGGIPETNFIKFMEWSCQFSHGRVEDWVEMHRLHPMLDEYNASKSCSDLSQIVVPAYIVADWGDQGLHTRGTIEAFAAISSAEKWLEVHGRKIWQYYYQPSSVARQKAFYDKFLKGIDNEVDSWPRVVLEVRERAYQGEMRAEDSWPIARTEYVKLFLDGPSRTLVEDMAPSEVALKYDATRRDDRVEFTYRFDQPTELTGGMKLRLWVEAERGSDMDVFVALHKLDRDGSFVPFVAAAMLEDGPVALGWLRVSHRETDPQRSTPWRPWHKHERRLLLEPGQVEPVDIEIWPSSTRFQGGEQLKLIIQGNDIFRNELRQARLHEDSVNAGAHVIHMGGRYDSHLLVPIVPPSSGHGE
ncbi:MAG TPA: CocE/NonD family hydrolase [Candidatus Dormibacteraeota bacterium]|nr:CocE/NonD family hydrolase [Candidatus Dormibacteraeota bacterium]